MGKKNLPASIPRKDRKRAKPVSDFYGVPVCRKCHAEPEDPQAAALMYTLNAHEFEDRSTKSALRHLLNGHMWASYATCWHLIHEVKLENPDDDAQAKDILLQAGSAIFGLWEPNIELLEPRPVAQPGWRATLPFRASINCASHLRRRSMGQKIDLELSEVIDIRPFIVVYIMSIMRRNLHLPPGDVFPFLSLAK